MFQDILDGMTQWFNDTIGCFATHLIVILIDFVNWMVLFVWDISNTILIEIDFGGTLLLYWSQLPPDIADMLTFFNVPIIINMVISAHLSSWILSIFRG